MSKKYLYRVFDNSVNNSWRGQRAARVKEGSVRSVRDAGRLSGSPCSPRVARRAINGRTLASRRLGGRAYWAIFKN